MSMKNIEHVVVLMLENRSLDNLLGWLYEKDAPQHNIPEVEPGEPRYDGLNTIDPEKFINTDASGKISSPPLRGSFGLCSPSIAPGEEFDQVSEQLFGDEHVVNTTEVPQMKGYLKDYVKVMEKEGYTPEECVLHAKMVMESYIPEQLQVLNGLAKHYAVSDRWFSSVPSQTNPNRAFSLCGNSMGLASNGYLETSKEAAVLGTLIGLHVGDDRFRSKTLWNALHESGETDWKIFWETSMIPQKISALLENIEDLAKFIEKTTDIDVSSIQFLADIADQLTDYLHSVSSGDVESCYTYRIFPLLEEKLGKAEAQGHFAKLEEFHKLAQSGNLPKFSYIEPFWTISKTAVDRGLQKMVTAMGDDHHAPANMDVGETYVKEIYKSLIANKKQWQKTLFLITFDEPVGCFDHVPPPNAVSPWEKEGVPDYVALQDGFEFRRYGGRVPAILVSPLIEKGTVFRSTTEVPYDHTSLIATILKWYGLEERTSEFGDRTIQAPTFDGVVTRDTPRQDAEEVPFLNINREPGSPVCYYDRFCLKEAGSVYTTTAVQDAKSASKVILESLLEFAEVEGLEGLAMDLGINAEFPTIDDGEKTIFYFQKADDRPEVGEVQYGDGVKIVSTQASVRANNVLGMWDDSDYCYLYNDYQFGDNNLSQVWTLDKKGGGTGALHYGDKVFLVNNFKKGKQLTRDGKWLTAVSEGSWWTIEPVVKVDNPNALQSGSSIFLRNKATGDFISATDKSGTQWYPTLATENPTTLRMDSTDESINLVDGDMVTFTCTSEGLIYEGTSYDILGAWSLSKTLYYYKTGYPDKQAWRIDRVAGNGPLLNGDEVYLVNHYFAEYLAPYKDYLTTVNEKSEECIWVIEKQ